MYILNYNINVFKIIFKVIIYFINFARQSNALIFFVSGTILDVYAKREFKMIKYKIVHYFVGIE